MDCFAQCPQHLHSAAMSVDALKLTVVMKQLELIGHVRTSTRTHLNCSHAARHVSFMTLANDLIYTLCCTTVHVHEL